MRAMPIPLASSPASKFAGEPSSYCGICGYDLRGLPNARCPECGHTFDPLEPIATLPWLHRTHLGLWTGFWRTVSLALLHPGRVARQVRPTVQVDPHASARFRALCGYIAAASVAITVMLLKFSPANWRAALACALAAAIWTKIFCYLASIPTDTTGLHWAEWGIRFRWLHEFTAAPLALTPALVPATLLGLYQEHSAGMAAALYPAFTAALILLTWMTYIIGFQIRAARRNGAWIASQVLVYLWWWGLLALFCCTMARITTGVLWAGITLVI
jgi:hypothetical protein